jgi:hypothetical protein
MRENKREEHKGPPGGREGGVGRLGQGKEEGEGAVGKGKGVLAAGKGERDKIF